MSQSTEARHGIGSDATFRSSVSLTTVAHEILLPFAGIRQEDYPLDSFSGANVKINGNLSEASGRISIQLEAKPDLKTGDLAEAPLSVQTLAHQLKMGTRPISDLAMLDLGFDYETGDHRGVLSLESESGYGIRFNTDGRVTVWDKSGVRLRKLEEITPDELKTGRFVLINDPLDRHTTYATDGIDGAIFATRLEEVPEGNDQLKMLAALYCLPALNGQPHPFVAGIVADLSNWTAAILDQRRDSGQSNAS